METFLLELFPYNPATSSVITVGFSNNLLEEAVPGSNTRFRVRMRPGFSHELSVYSENLPSGAKVSFGTVSLNNTDGDLNDLLSYEWKGRELKLYRGVDATQYSDYDLLFYGSVSEITADRNSITLIITERTQLIPVVLQENFYSGAGGKNGFIDLRNVPKPLCFGYCKNVSPVLVDPVNLIYQVHDGSIVEVEKALDGGSELLFGAQYATYELLSLAANKPADGSFNYSLDGFIRLGAPVAHFLNADVKGEFYSEVSLANTVKQVILSRTSLTTSDLDSSSFSALHTKYPGRVQGMFYRNLDIGFQEWLENCIASLDSFWYFGLDGKIHVKSFDFSAPVQTIRDSDWNQFQLESIPRPLKEVKVEYDRNSDPRPVTDFVLRVGDLGVYLENEVVWIDTAAEGSGGTYTYSGVAQAVVNGEEVSDLEAVTFSCGASWINLSPDGTFTISDPGTATATAEIQVNFAEFSAAVPFTLIKSMGATFKSLTLSVSDNVFDYDANGTPQPDTQSSVITATRTNGAGSIVWTATDNLGQTVSLTGTGDSRTLTASSVSSSPLVAHVDIKATAPDGSYNQSRVILSRASTGYFNALNDILTIAQGKVTIFYQDAAPTTGIKDGDLWFDTNDDNKLYRRYLGSWVFINDARIALALTNAAGAQATADGKIKTFIATSAPTAEAVGDLWYNPNTKSFKRWNGTDWNSEVSTVGAIAGTNLTNSGGTILSDAAIQNSNVSIGANGALTGAGGGQVTVAGLGYAGALSALDSTASTILNTVSGQFTTFANGGVFTVGYNSLTKTSTGVAAAHSVQFTRGVNFRVRVLNPLNVQTIILSPNTSSAAYAAGDYGFYFDGTNIRTLNNGVVTLIGPPGSYEEVAISYDSTTGIMNWWRGQQKILTATISTGLSFYAGLRAGSTSGYSIENILIEPYSTIIERANSVEAGALVTIGEGSLNRNGFFDLTDTTGRLLGWLVNPGTLTQLATSESTKGRFVGRMVGTASLFSDAFPVKPGQTLFHNTRIKVHLGNDGTGTGSSRYGLWLSVSDDGVTWNAFAVAIATDTTRTGATWYTTNGTITLAANYSGTVPRYARLYLRNLATGSGEVWVDFTDIRDQQESATVGARAGTNLTNSGGTILNDSAIQNSNIAIGANGALTGAGGGQVTATGLGLEAGADVTSFIVGPAEILVAYDYTGTVKTDELPKGTQYRMFRAGSALTTGVTWSVAVISGTATVSISGTGNGASSVTALSSNEAKIRLTATFGGVSRQFEAMVRKVFDPPPVGGSGSGNPGTTASTSAISGTSSTSYGSANSPILTVKAGTAGQVALSAPLETYRNTNGTMATEGKWQWRTVGGVWADVTTPVSSTDSAFTETESGVVYKYPGSLSVSQVKTGLTSGTDYEFQLLLRCVTASASTSYTGTATAAGS